tara:strand:- start:4416 stop:6392 length:1977 start_codon:yes stop_codon:yes gene_type:complete
MFDRLTRRFLSDYNRMALVTIGSWRFIGKLPAFALRMARRLGAKVFARQNWPPRLSEIDDRPSELSGTWLFGARASLSTPEFAKDRKRVMAQAEDARRGIFQINGRRVDVSASPNFGRWDVDPISGRRWRQDSVFLPLAEVPGDIRFPWELGRLHHLACFGQAWRYTRNQAWTEVGLAHLEQILSEAPFEHGIHWRDGLQLAVRIFSVVAFADLCHDASPNTHRFINDVVASHAFSLTRQMSPHSEITNNHAIGEASALALAGIYLQRDDYVRRGLRRLRLEVERQIYSDGVPYEGSIPYIRFDLDFLTLLALALKASRRQIPFWLMDSIALIAKALARLADAKGRVPPIGDGDDARVLRLDEEPYLNVNESLHVASKIVGEPFAPKSPSESFALWTVGHDSPCTRLLERTCYLPRSGLVHLNRGELDVWLDCGPTGYGLSGPGGHGHNDTTAIVVHLNGKALLHDPGWYTYHGDSGMRDTLRSTRAHNTVRIEEQEQARLGSTFEIVDDCKPTSVRIREFGSATAVTCGHTGYCRLDKGITYRRTVVVEGKGPWLIRITDRIRSRLPVKVEAHLGSDLPWTQIKQSEWSLPEGHSLYFKSGYESIRMNSVPCSRETGSLQRGTALDWGIPPRRAVGDLGFFYVTRWEVRVCNKRMCQ